MASLFQRQSSSLQKAQRSVTKQLVWRMPFILFAAMTFLLFVWIDSRDGVLVRKLESPDGSQTMSRSKQTPPVPKSNAGTHSSSKQTDFGTPSASMQTDSSSAGIHSKTRQKHSSTDSRADSSEHSSSVQTDLASTQQKFDEANNQTGLSRSQDHDEASYQDELSSARKRVESRGKPELQSAQEFPELRPEMDLSSSQTDLSNSQEYREASSLTDLSSALETHNQTGLRSAQEHHEASLRKDSSSPQNISEFSEAEVHQCDGRRIFVYDLPAEFNEDIVKDCKKWNNWLEWSMCDDVINNGFGEQMNLPASDFMASVLQPASAWFETDQFSLEVTLHSRLKTYPCLTQDFSQASIFYIPFYHALDLTRHIYNANLTTRDYLAVRMVQWLRRQTPFRLHGGHRHVIPLGRVVWDFWRRDKEPWTGKWGSAIVAMPELENITKLFIERSPWIGSRQVAIPYPTSFHPSSQSELRAWQSTVRGSLRPHLASFAGSSRNRNMSGTVRGELFRQCADSPRCEHLACTEELCHKTSRTIYQLALLSVFCLQPAGDSPTRKGIFDSLVAGCIPVVFDRNQTVLQYLWHLPGNGSRYSVILNGGDVIKHYDVMQHLERMPREEVARLQESVVEFFPQIVYRNPELNGEYTSKDAFDVLVDGLLDTFHREEVSNSSAS